MTKAEQPVIGIVNDEAAVRESLRLLLEVAGHVVETFASAAELLDAEIARLTCVILDNHMPHMTGLELAERLRSDGSAIPIFLIVGSPAPTVLLRAAEVGIDRVLEKPVDYEGLHDFANATRSRAGSRYPDNSDHSARLSRGLPTFLKRGSAAANASVESETDFSGWHGDRRNIEMFLCGQFPEAQPNWSNETDVRPEKRSTSSKSKPRPTITLRQMAAELANSQNLPKKHTAALLGELMALATRHLKDGGKVRLTGLGILQVRSRPARMGRNPGTGEAIKIKAGKKITFRAAKELKTAV